MSNQRIIAGNYLRLSRLADARKRRLCFACSLITNEHTYRRDKGEEEGNDEKNRRCFRRVALIKLLDHRSSDRVSSCVILNEKQIARLTRLIVMSSSVQVFFAQLR